MRDQFRVQYGKGYRVLDCSPLEDDGMMTPGVTISLRIERPDGSLFGCALRAQHRPYRDFYDKLSEWTQAKLNRKELAEEALPEFLNSTLMNEIDDM